MLRLSALLLLAGTLLACQKDDPAEPITDTTSAQYPAVSAVLNLDLNNLPSYTTALPTTYPPNIGVNTPANNPTTDKGATLGRVLFYDRQLSLNNTVSCASCHKQGEGFGDNRQFSAGFQGNQFTTAHSMRLANAMYYLGPQFFWDKRAPTLEFQTTQPMVNAIEMGFDNTVGGIDSLIRKLEQKDYYRELFTWVYGDADITEARMQLALAQFIRSMVSYNSKFDQGFAQVFNPAVQPGAGIEQNFPNYTASENRGKLIFLRAPNNGGGGCGGCHTAPSFALTANSLSNGLDAGETTVFKSPSLKNIGVGGPYMHDGRFATLAQVVEHYNSGIQNSPSLDNRLKTPGGQPLRLNLTQQQKDDLVAFLMTLDDTALATDSRFSNPFK